MKITSTPYRYLPLEKKARQSTEPAFSSRQPSFGKTGAEEKTADDKPYRHLPEFFANFTDETFMNDDWKPVSGSDIIKYFVENHEALDDQPGPNDLVLGSTAYPLLNSSKYFEVLRDVFGYRNRTSQIIMRRSLLDSGILAMREVYLDVRTGQPANWEDKTLDKFRHIELTKRLSLAPRVKHVYHLSTLTSDAEKKQYIADHPDVFPFGENTRLTTITPLMTQRPGASTEDESTSPETPEASKARNRRMRLAVAGTLGIAALTGALYFAPGLHSGSSTQPAGQQATRPVHPSTTGGYRNQGRPIQQVEKAPDPAAVPRFRNVETVLQEFSQNNIGKTVYEISHNNGYYSYLLKTLGANGTKTEWKMLANVDAAQKAQLDQAFEIGGISIRGLEASSGVNQTSSGFADAFPMMGTFLMMGLGMLLLSRFMQRGQGGGKLKEKQLALIERQVKHMESMDDMSKHKGSLVETEMKERLSHVGGNYIAKRELKDLIDDIQKRRTGEDVELPRGILLEGPPGNGKTLMARALAGEAGVPFISITGSDFDEKLVGVGTGRVANLFEEGRKQAKEKGACIIFIDELDAVGKARSATGSGGSDAKADTLNKLLTELDGFKSSENIIVLGATNRKDMLDKALTNRPSRFSQTIHIPNPQTDAERREILEIHANRLCKKYGMTLEPVQPEEGGDPKDLLTEVSAMCRGLSGDQLQEVVKKAIKEARKQDRKTVTLDDCIEGFQILHMGHKSLSPYSESVRRKTSFHELGHLIVAWACGKKPFVISAIPREKSLGRVIIDPRSFEETNMSKGDYLSQIALAMGGLAGEMMEYGDLGRTNGLASDIDMARNALRQMISFGMFPGNYALNVMKPEEELTDEQIDLMNRVFDQAIEVAQDVLRIYGKERLEVMTEEALAMKEEIIGPKAVEFILRHTPGDVAASINARIAAFMKDPSGDQPKTTEPAVAVAT